MFWSICFVKISKKKKFVFSSSSIYDFSIVCLVIFTNFFYDAYLSIQHVVFENLVQEDGRRGYTKREARFNRKRHKIPCSSIDKEREAEKPKEIRVTRYFVSFVLFLFYFFLIFYISFAFLKAFIFTFFIKLLKINFNLCLN